MESLLEHGCSCHFLVRAMRIPTFYYRVPLLHLVICNIGVLLEWLTWDHYCRSYHAGRHSMSCSMRAGFIFRTVSKESAPFYVFPRAGLCPQRLPAALVVAPVRRPNPLYCAGVLLRSTCAAEVLLSKSFCKIISFGAFAFKREPFRNLFLLTFGLVHTSSGGLHTSQKSTKQLN